MGIVLVVDRCTWTDERLDDLASRMDAGFERVDREMKAGFERVDHDIRDLRSETQRQFSDLYRMIVRFNVAMLACVLSTVLALVGTLVANSMGTP